MKKTKQIVKKRRLKKLEGFNLIPNTAGKISNGIFLKDDKSEIIIRFAWGGDLHYKPLEENEKSL